MLIIVIILGILVVILGSGDIYYYKKYKKCEKSCNKYTMMAIAYKALGTSLDIACDDNFRAALVTEEGARECILNALSGTIRELDKDIDEIVEEERI